MIHRFDVKNFKSIAHVDVELSPVTVLVGRSGTGKSNFVEALRFLRDYLVTSSENRSQSRQNLLNNWQLLLPATNPEANLRFEVEFSISGMEDRFVYSLDLASKSVFGNQLTLVDELLSLGEKTLFHQKAEFDTRGDFAEFRWIVKPELVQVPDPGPVALGRIPSISEVVTAYTALTSGIGCYVFSDTTLCETAGQNRKQKSSNQDVGNIGLDDNAQNYLQTLKEIVSNLRKLDVRKKIVATLQRLNPAISSVELNNIQQPDHIVVGHKFGEKTLDLSLAQESCGLRRFYAHLLALYQQPPKETLIFEHPEDGIHPGALSLLAEEFNSAPDDGNGQIILTTHNPRFLDHFEAEQIRVVELDGFETQIGPLSKEQQDAIQEKLLDAGELLTVDPARIEVSISESTGA